MLVSCNSKTHLTLNELKEEVNEIKSNIDGDIAVAFLDLSNKENQILINSTKSFHAASTMKVPIMIELFKQQTEKKLNLNDSIVLKNKFKSIVDGSWYKMDIGDDSDDITHSKVDTKQRLYDLMYNMITVSSNLATNVLIELVGAKNTTASMRSLGADKIEVLRGVEDQKAYDLGLNNSTTALDLLVIMKAISVGEAGTKEDCKKMISVLLDQKWNDMIPLYLPKKTKIAHKTGSISGVHHDAAIVYLPDSKNYILVLLSKNLKDFNKGTMQLAEISKLIYNFMTQE
jgi:beta-lactamase class A